MTQTLAQYFYLRSISPNDLISTLIILMNPITNSFSIVIIFLIKHTKLPHHTTGVKHDWSSIGKNGRAKLITEKIQFFTMTI